MNTPLTAEERDQLERKVKKVAHIMTYGYAREALNKNHEMAMIWAGEHSKYLEDKARQYLGVGRRAADVRDRL